MYFYSAMYSNSQKIQNGNILICEGTTGRIFEITEFGEIVWEFINYFPSEGQKEIFSRSYPVYCAFRYDMNYPGIRTNII